MNDKKTIDQHRAEFEAAISKIRLLERGYFLIEDGKYLNCSFQRDWEIWKAAKGIEDQFNQGNMMSDSKPIDCKTWLHNAVAKAVEQGKEEAKTLSMQGLPVALDLWIAPSTETLYGDIALSTDKPSGDDWELWFSSVVDGGTPYEYWHTRVHDAVRNAPILAYGVEHQTRETFPQPDRPKG